MPTTIRFPFTIRQVSEFEVELETGGEPLVQFTTHPAIHLTDSANERLYLDAEALILKESLSVIHNKE